MEHQTRHESQTTLYQPCRETTNKRMQCHKMLHPQALSADPKTTATAAARQAETKDGEMEQAGEVGLGDGASEVCA